MGPIQGAIVNWFGHKVGYRNFNLSDHSKNTLPLDFLLMGELYQNNHHRFSNKMNFAYRWFELDLTYVLSKPLKFLKIININPNS
jgi:stearoyl-CoA desaturase (delta-9 desaturase)